MKAPVVAKPKENVPPKPFSGQTMINVAGRKFLVIPHPVIESPPPSPPLTNQNPAPAVATSTSTNQRPPPPGPPLPRTEKLNVMLKPAEPEAASSSGAPMPCFDVEMTAEGKYLLVPRDNSASSSSTRNVFSTAAEAGSSGSLAQSASAAVKVGMYLGGGSQFSQNLSYGYAAILEVFKHLSVKERAASARVCKLWRDVSRHPSLWTSISLKVRKIFL